MDSQSGVGMRKGAWTEEEDALLRKYVEKYGEGKWGLVLMRAGLNRCRKSCRLRWLNYLRPNIRRGNFHEDEDDLIIRLHGLLGNRWSLIAGRLPERTANDIKNYWNSHLSKTVSMQTRGKQSEVKAMNTTAIKVIKPQPRSFSPNSIWLSGHGSSIIETQMQQMSNNNVRPDPEEETESWWKSLLAKEAKEEEGKAEGLWWLGSWEGRPGDQKLAESFAVEENMEKMSKAEDDLLMIKEAFGHCESDVMIDVDLWGLL